MFCTCISEFIHLFHTALENRDILGVARLLLEGPYECPSTEVCLIDVIARNMEEEDTDVLVDTNDLENVDEEDPTDPPMPQ